MLLLWGTLHPQGSSKLASIRFSGPVRIRSIRIYPRGTSLFVQNPEAVSETEPDAFSLSVFLNAQAAPSVQEPKPKGTNVLVPTSLIYPGGLREYPLDMGADFVTRLMVIQGDFVRVTLAVYGDAVSEPPSDPIPYEHTPLPTVLRQPLSSPLDVSSAVEPSRLSRQLLALMPRSPTLSSAIRLTFCLRQVDEEPDNDRFGSLEECIETDVPSLDWLERVANTLITPVDEDVDVDSVKKLSEMISQSLVEKTNDHLYVLAGLLRHASAQPEIIVWTILESLDLSDILESNLLDKHILERLNDAAANPIIARALGAAPVISTLQSFQKAHTTNWPSRRAAVALHQRILGWERFEKALSNLTPDFAALASWIKELTSEDLIFGVFLLSLLEQEPLFSKINRLPLPEPPANLMALWNSTSLPSFPEFVTFVRAFLGVGYVMVSLCWADKVADTSRMEQIFAMLRLWQEVDGYREIVNCLLLLPQVMYRLEGTVRHASSPPDVSAMLVKQLLTCLCTYPESMTRPELASLVDALMTSFPFIIDDEQVDMAEVTAVAEGGLPQAIQTVSTWSNRSFNGNGGCALHGALVIVERTLEDRETGEWKIMQTAWQVDSHGLVYRLVDLLGQLVNPVQDQFLLVPQSFLHPFALAQLLSSSNATMRILSRLLPGNPLPRRLNRALVHHIATLFIATDAVDSRYPQGSTARQAARMVRPTCAETISVLSSIKDDSDRDGVIGEAVLRTLLHIGLHPEGDDPAARLEQVFWLLDLVLPLSISDTNVDRTEERFWTTKIIPNVLLELQQFSRSLCVDHQIQLVERLTALDRGDIGLNQWFLSEELKHFSQVIDSFKAYQLDPDRVSIFQAQLAKSLQFLAHMITSYPISSTPEIFQNITRVAVELMSCSFTSPRVVDFACALVPCMSSLDLSGQLNVLMLLLRNAVSHHSSFEQVEHIFPYLDRVPEQDVLRVAVELSPVLRWLTDEKSSQYWLQDEARLADTVISCLSWFLRQTIPVIPVDISRSRFTSLISRLKTILSEQAEAISDIGNKFTFSDDDNMSSPAQDMCESITISPERLLELLNARPKTPPTPRLSGESIFRMATISPIAALVGTTGTSTTLTKTYQNNDFRQLSVRQNTSRRPSMHVDVGI